VQAALDSGRTAPETRFLAGVGLAAAEPHFSGVNPLLVLLGAGVLTGGRQWIVGKEQEAWRRFSPAESDCGSDVLPLLLEDPSPPPPA